VQNSLNYENEEINESKLLVHEASEKYISYLEAATDQYMDALKDIERRCIKKDEDTDSIYQELTVLSDSMLQVCEQFEDFVNDEAAIKTAQVAFRDKTEPIISKSYGASRVRTWPQGYQGDYKTIEFMYRNTPMSEGIGYYIDKYVLSATLAVGVRERMRKLAELLKAEMINRQYPKVLDIACGSCRELHEIVPEIEKARAHFKCIDLDSDALDFALNRLSYAGLSADRAEFIQYNALRMFDYETAVSAFGMQDIIYSVGYFDYLADDFLMKLLRTLYMLLNPGGKLIAAFKDANRYRSQLYHWFADWDGFLQRTEDDFEKLFRRAEIPSSALTMTRVKSGSIIFYIATKH
jgi:extracellular factor (EF) 3-hydroxypalmitic acid methyl ester biosynthesis protein